MPPKRKNNPAIPSWIDQSKLPVGCYWNTRDSYWYTLSRDKKRTRTKIAGHDATMWELNEAMALPTGDVTLAKLMRDFARSDKFKRLAFSTQKGYVYCEAAVQQFQIGINRYFADAPLSDVTTASIQCMVNAIAATHRAKANYIKRYLSTAFVWGINHGMALSNPAFDVNAAKPHDGLDDGVVLAVLDVPTTKPSGAHRIRWIASNLGSWMFNTSQIVEKSVARGERITADGGIYFLISGGRVCYVGKSSCIRSRVGNHKDDGIAFDRVAAIRGIPKWAMDEVEQCYIARLNPSLNMERSRVGQLHEIEGVERHLHQG